MDCHVLTHPFVVPKCATPVAPQRRVCPFQLMRFWCFIIPSSPSTFLNVNYFCLISTKFLQQEDFIYAPSHSLSVHVTMSRNIVQHQWKTLYVADLEVHDNVFPCMYLEWNYSSISFFFFFLTCLLFWILFLTSFVLEMFLPFVPNISGEGVQGFHFEQLMWER